MGRLPAQFAQRVITMRVPYGMPGEMVMASASGGIPFPDATFMNNVDKPFEIHRMIPRITAVDATSLAEIEAQPDQETLGGFLRLMITDLGKNQNLTKNPTLVKLLTKGSTELTWEFAEPYYIKNTEMIQVVVSANTFPTFGGVAVKLRMEVNFQGYLVVLAPASEDRG